MTENERKLLLKDLCARLPYQPMCEFTDTEDDFCTATAALGYSLRDFIAGKVLIKPYLRPMSSMTEEEQRTLDSMCNGVEMVSRLSGLKMFDKAFDWLNANHFDYHGLIPMGLALEAKEDMYKLNEDE